jgi:CRISPR/Cas system CSM-associated protein Csm3 (group 7 of RAMP superfamily)
VAIDRWTGGAAEGFLYSGLEPGPLTWEPIRLRLDLNLLSEEKPALALLYLTLRDLDRGRIALGFGANRGYGSLKVNKLATDLEALKGFPEPPLELETAFRDWVATAERA